MSRGAGAPGTYPPEVVAAMGAPPTEEQWRAISMPLEPYVIVAGAGSGKTSVMAARIVYLALVARGLVEADHGGVLPGNVLCLTFTNKATENLMLRVRRALRALELPEGEEPEVLNYHGFAAQVIERYGLLAGIEPGQRILSPAQRTELCARVLDRVSFRNVAAEWQPSLIAKILELAQQAADHRVDLDRIVEFNQARLEELREYRTDKAYQSALERIELAGAAKVFAELKRERGLIDFADQISLALDVCERFPQVGADYRSRFATALLDEYQDTNVAQARLIASVFGGGFPVTAVGDPDQNIYAWRGASLYNLLQFPDQFRRQDGSPASRLPLYTNFRSGARILSAADRVIEDLPPEQRPDPDKVLAPWPQNGQGEVEVVRHTDEWAEATGIAERILGLRARGEPWSSCAVLCRSSRLFYSMQEVFAERGIPVEVVGLAGLLSLPEVVEVLAYARAVADPYASVALARVLLGPRYRVGFKDLARVASWAKERNRPGRATEEGEALPFLFTEALEHLDEVHYLSEEGRRRLEEFREELATLREQARRPLGEFLAEIMRRTGLLAELDASADAAVAAARRRNLGAFLGEVDAFAPVEGELTLRAFLDYVDAVEASDRPEWAPVQPSEEDSVKVMTIHQAKGLEFDTVFVPGLALDLLPNNRIQQNPAERGKSMDFELRGDAEILPRFAGNLREFWRALKDQELIEERRTCYVALTRARRRLFVSGAWWYGETQNAKKPSVFFDELALWGEETGMAQVDRGPDPDGDNPLIGYRERLVRDWPEAALRDEADELFPQGWRRAALELAAARAGRGTDGASAGAASGGAQVGGEGAGGAQVGGDSPAPAEPAEVSEPAEASAPAEASDPAAGLSPSERAELEERAAGTRLLAEHLLERERARAAMRGALPPTVSVGGVVDYAKCPKRFYWSVIRPLPRFGGPAARIGTDVHRWIERRSSGQTTLIDVDELPDLAPEELAGDPGRTDRLREAFLASRFAGVVPLYTERPFLLAIEEFVVSGRIDAIFGQAEGPWEIVDYKTGRRPPPEDMTVRLQLDLYALACIEVWRKRAEDLTLTYLYLATSQEDTRPADDPAEIRLRVLEALRGMAQGRFDPTPGEQCRWCDFLSFCQAGQSHLAGAQGR